MAFLLKSDYAAQIKQDQLNIILDANEQIRLSAELSAQAELESYLRGRYDVGQIFIDVLPWAAGAQYAAGAVVYHGPAAAPVIYVAAAATKGDEPGAEVVAEDEPRKWQAKDPRHQLIITYLIDAVLYLIHSRQNPRGVPQIRQDRYDHVIEWLNLCRQGKISPGLPFLPDTAADGTENRDSIRIRSGSKKKLRNSY